MSLTPSELAKQAVMAKVIDDQIVVVTADGSQRREDVPLRDFLERIRRAFNMDVVFVSRFADGRRVIREVAADSNDDVAVTAGMSDALEQSYCHHIVHGRLPEVIPDTRDVPLANAMEATHRAKVASHLATALVSADGKAFGTICCYSHHPRPNLGHQADLAALRTIAELLLDALGA